MRCAVFATPPADDDPLTRAVAHRLGRDAFTGETAGAAAGDARGRGLGEITRPLYPR